MADINSLSIEQLEDLMEHPEKKEEFLAEPEPKTTEPEPVPEPATQDVETPVEETPAEPAPEPEVDYDRQALLAQLEELQARQRQMDSKTGRLAGELDYWRKRAEQKPESPATDDRIDEPEEPKPVNQPKRDSTTAWVVAQAAREGFVQFSSEHPDSKEMLEDIDKYLKDTNYDASRILLSEDPLEAQKETQRAFGEAYWHVKAERAAKIRAEVETKRAEQFARQKEAKQRASVSASGSVPPPQPKPKTFNDMTDKELEAELDRRLSLLR